MNECTPDESGYCAGGCVTRPHTWSASGARCARCNIIGTGDRCNDGNCPACDECSEDYGPCEEHGETIVQREGASTRTADDLLLLFCEDATAVLLDVTGEDRTTPWARDVMVNAETLLANNASMDVRWFPAEDAEALTDDLVTLQWQFETELASLDVPMIAYWDDGYRIVKVTGGPLAE